MNNSESTLCLDRKIKATDPFHCPYTCPLSRAAHHNQHKPKNKRGLEQKADREWEVWLGQNAELEECHFVFTTKKGQRRVSEKVSARALSLISFPSWRLLSTPRPCGKGTYPLRICTLHPQSPEQGTFTEDSQNVHYQQKAPCEAFVKFTTDC